MAVTNSKYVGGYRRSLATDATDFTDSKTTFKSSSDISVLPIRMRSFSRVKCGEVYSPASGLIAERNAATDPLPFVPAIKTDPNASCGFLSARVSACIFRKSYRIDRYSFVREKRYVRSSGVTRLGYQARDSDFTTPVVPFRPELYSCNFPRCSNGRGLPSSWISPEDTARHTPGIARAQVCSTRRSRSPDTSRNRRKLCRVWTAAPSTRRRNPVSGMGRRQSSA